MEGTLVRDGGHIKDKIAADVLGFSRTATLGCPVFAIEIPSAACTCGLQTRTVRSGCATKTNQPRAHYFLGGVWVLSTTFS
jgi:hypothetical protein